MAKNFMTHDAYDARAAGLLNSAVQIETARWRISSISKQLDASSPHVLKPTKRRI